MQIDPKISYWINVVLSILMVLGGGSAWLTNFVDAHTAAQIAAASTAFAMVLNTFLHGYSGAEPGPLLPPNALPPPNNNTAAVVVVPPQQQQQQEVK